MLDSVKRKAIFLLVTTDLTDREICEELGVHYNSLVRWKKDEKFRKAHKEFVTMFLADHSSKALRTIIELMDNEDPKVRLNAAKDILDRAGFIATEDININEQIKIEIVNAESGDHADT